MNLPRVYLGSARGRRTIAKIMALGWGRIACEFILKPEPGEPWAMDNGAFVDFQNGRELDSDAFMFRLYRQRSKVKAHPPEFAVCPDIVAGGARSLDFSLSWIDRLPSDWPWYLVVQDGMSPDRVSASVDRFAGVFLGGSDAFKASASEWLDLARENGVPFHYGRCGTLGKLEAAIDLGVDSLDSSFPLWTNERFAEFASVWRASQYQGSLF